MTNQESQRGWLALVPKGNVSFYDGTNSGARHSTDGDRTTSYLGDHLHLTNAGDRYFNKAVFSQAVRTYQ